VHLALALLCSWHYIPVIDNAKGDREMTAKFQIGDTVARKVSKDSNVFVVTWVSKCGELIATEYNGYHNPCDWASGYKKVSAT